MKRLFLFIQVLCYCSILITVSCKKDNDPEIQIPVDINHLRVYSATTYKNNGQFSNKIQYSYYPDGMIKGKRIWGLLNPELNDTSNNNRQLYIFEYIRNDNVITANTYTEDPQGNNVLSGTGYYQLNEKGLIIQSSSQQTNDTTSDILYSYYYPKYDSAGHLIYTYHIEYFNDSTICENVLDRSYVITKWENGNISYKESHLKYSMEKSYNTYYPEMVNTIELTGELFRGEYNKNPLYQSKMISFGYEYLSTYTYVIEHGRIIRRNNVYPAPFDELNNGYTIYEYVEI